MHRQFISFASCEYENVGRMLWRAKSRAVHQVYNYTVCIWKLLNEDENEALGFYLIKIFFLNSKALTGCAQLAY